MAITTPIGGIVKDTIGPMKDQKLISPLPNETSVQAPGLVAPVKQPDTNWANGNLDIKDSGVFYTPAQKEGATVAKNLEGLLASGSPYIEAARAGAQRQANSRGLLNSTMAATAGEKAGIEAALPIAQQDAGFMQQQELNTQQGEIQRGLYETQGNISERLAQGGYDQEKVIKQMDMDWNQVDLQARMDVEYDRMDADNKQKFNELSNMISEDYMNDYIEIMLNPNFREPEDRQRAFDILSENTKRRYEMAGAVSNVDLTWPGVPEPTGSSINEAAETEKDKSTIEKKRDKAAAELAAKKKKADEDALNRR